jgi:hypothetical protein
MHTSWPRSRAFGSQDAASSRHVLDAALADVICTANDAYLSDLARSASRSQADTGLPCNVVASLSALDGAARRRIAAVPFTLFSMKFNDTCYWQSVIERRAGAPRRSTSEGFGRTAVFLAWHLVQTGHATAGVALGMSSEVAALYQWLPLGDLDRIGGLAQTVVAPRWPTNRAFWQRLLAAARSTVAIDTARFFGLQLLAAETLQDGHLRSRA